MWQGAPISTRAPSAPVFPPQVSDPIKRDDGSSALAMVGKKYVEYLVTTSTNLPGFNSCQFSVRRRFRDFVTLAEVLADSHRGYFIPQRPEKTLMEGQMSADKEFVEERRMQLERYLAALAAHPVRALARSLARPWCSSPSNSPTRRAPRGVARGAWSVACRKASKQI